jgi:hypothetical protein
MAQSTISTPVRTIEHRQDRMDKQIRLDRDNVDNMGKAERAAKFREGMAQWK